jgi:hypothetical protein
MKTVKAMKAAPAAMKTTPAKAVNAMKTVKAMKAVLPMKKVQAEQGNQWVYVAMKTVNAMEAMQASMRFGQHPKLMACLDLDSLPKSNNLIPFTVFMATYTH